MAKDEPMDRQLRQRVCNLPTKQNPHTQETHTNIWDHHTQQRKTIPANSHGPYHWPTPRNGKDAILTIVDHRCSRAAIFLPCSTTITGPGIAQLYLRHLYPWFGLPRKIISDRDPRFTSHFGKALATKLNVQQNISTAFHPQMDGLSPPRGGSN